VSLSRRLVLTLLAVSAVGLLALDLVSYVALRSYLSDRVDQQARDAVPLVVRSLGSEILGLPSPEELPLPPDAGSSEQPGGPVGLQLPVGTYGEIRGPEGQVVAGRVVSGDRDLPPPDFPDQLPDAAGFEGTSPLEVPSEDGGSGFRVTTQTGPSGEVVVAAIPLTDLDATLSRLRTIEVLVTLAILAALAALSWWAVRVGLRPLARIEETAGEIAAGDMSHRVADVDERTEVGRLGIAFNEMLSRIERAFADQRASEERLRRFLADASHELRTPLSSIRGYAELFRLGAGADPADLERSMHRIESESARMSGLVDDLLTLARLDEVRELRREDVDLAAVAADACADALAAAPDREIALSLPPDPAGASVTGDPDQLRQVVSNLIGNAVAHAPAGTIEVSVSRTGSSVALRVRDHGPGLPEGSEESVFERFWRTGEARGRDTGGAGLGLAIVAGVAEAHGGSVRASTVAEADGGGALFEVQLPAIGRLQ
jgi:two-component system OmpR family sensor kinase